MNFPPEFAIDPHTKEGEYNAIISATRELEAAILAAEIEIHETNPTFH